MKSRQADRISKAAIAALFLSFSQNGSSLDISPEIIPIPQDGCSKELCYLEGSKVCVTCFIPDFVTIESRQTSSPLETKNDSLEAIQLLHNDNLAESYSASASNKDKARVEQYPPVTDVRKKFRNRDKLPGELDRKRNQ